MKRRGPDVVGPAEARAILGGISRARMSQLAQRADFPPHTELEIGRVWDRRRMLAFQAARTGKARRSILKALEHYDQHGNVKAAAREAGVTRSTMYRWLDMLAIPTPEQTGNGHEPTTTEGSA